MRTVFLIICGLFVACAGATEAWDLNQLMHTLAQVKAMNARFQERKELAVLAEPLLLAGTLRYQAPHYLQKHTLQPHEERYTVDQDWLTIETSEGQRNLYLPGHAEVGALVEAIRATLAGDLTNLERYYRLQLQGSPSAWTLRLEPLNKQMAEYVSAIIFQGQGERVLNVETLESGGDRSVMTIEPTHE
ncbi:MAG: LolA-related protein [Candidatus Competibacteraceae bacterium]